jgi:hypothetical protein
MAGTNQLEQFLRLQVLDMVTAPIFAGTNVSLLEMAKLQAQVLLPVLKAFQSEIGEERANQIARTALQEWPHKLFQDMGARLHGDPRQEWEAIYAALIQRFSNDAEVEVLRQEPDAPEFNANGSRSADIFRELGKQELRSAPVCDEDLDIAAVSDSEVRIDLNAKENEWCEVW